jgi:hypothetical protein
MGEKVKNKVKTNFEGKSIQLRTCNGKCALLHGVVIVAMWTVLVTCVIQNFNILRLVIFMMKVRATCT